MSDFLLFFKRDSLGVPVVAQGVKTLTSIHEDTGLIPGLPQWVKDPVIAVSCGEVADGAQMWCCCGCGVGLQLQLQLDF